MLNKIIKRGQIYMAELGSGKGSVQGGSRPVIVISNQLNNKFAPTVNVLPITSKTKNSIPVHVDIGIESGLQTESVILVEQAIVINKSQITKYIDECSKDKMISIAKAIVLQMSLDEELQIS